MSKKPSWKEIAHRLGDRMEYHAYCGTHSLDEADPKNCAFCHDRAVYAEYVQRLLQDGEEPVERFPGPWTAVALQDVVAVIEADGEAENDLRTSSA